MIPKTKQIVGTREMPPTAYIQQKKILDEHSTQTQDNLKITNDHIHLSSYTGSLRVISELDLNLNEDLSANLLK